MTYTQTSAADLHAWAPPFLRRLRRFLLSPAFMLALSMIECAATALDMQIPVAIGFVFLITAILVLSDDIFATTFPFLLLTVLVSYCHEDNPYAVFIGFIWLAIPVVAALLFHFIYYRGHYRIGHSFAGLLAVSAAIALGGVGCLSPAEYFTPAALYYVAGLGFGMLGIYMILKAQLNRKRDYDVRETLLLALYLTAVCAAFFTLNFYADRLIWMKDDLEIYGHLRLISIDNRNIFATYLLLGLPAPFYYTARGRGIHLLPALVLFGCLMLTGSRGGMLMGAALFALCFLYLLRRDRAHRLRNRILLALLALAAVAASGFLLKFYSFRFENGFIEGNEPRVLLLKRAVTDFLSHPVFGVGLGYTGNADIYDPKTFAMNWYHMMIPQVVAGLGLAGTAAYGLLLTRRGALALRLKDPLSRALVLCYVGLLLMSQVNPGEFCPMPYELVAVMIFLFLENEAEKQGASGKNDNEQALCGLLGTALFGAPPAISEKTDLDKVLSLAKDHMVFGVAGEGLGALPEDALAPDTLLALQDLTVTLLRQNTKLSSCRRALCAFWEERHIPYAILKGDAVARYYPTPDLRVAGDIDCLLPQDRIAETGAFLEQQGFTLTPCPDGEDHHTVYTKGQLEIELHHAVSGLPEGKKTAFFNTLTADTLNTALRTDNGASGFYAPDPFHQAFVLLLHMQQHMREGGLGLRQVLDWALFVQKEWPHEDAALCAALRETGLYRFAETVTLACVRHLSLPAAASPFSAGDAALADALFADFLAGGNFGKSNELYAGSAVVTLHRHEDKGALATALTNVKAKCRAEWPITEKHGALLLLFVPFWVIRRLLTGKRSVSPVAMLRSAGARGKLYDKLKLFKPEKNR